MDTSKPDGMKRRICDTTKIRKMGWESTISLEQGIKKLYDWIIKENLYIPNIEFFTGEIWDTNFGYEVLDITY